MSIFLCYLFKCGVCFPFKLNKPNCKFAKCAAESVLTGNLREVINCQIKTKKKFSFGCSALGNYFKNIIMTFVSPLIPVSYLLMCMWHLSEFCQSPWLDIILSLLEKCLVVNPYNNAFFSSGLKGNEISYDKKTKLGNSLKGHVGRNWFLFTAFKVVIWFGNASSPLSYFLWFGFSCVFSPLVCVCF